MKNVSQHDSGNIFHFLLPVFILGMLSSCTIERHDKKTKQKILKEELQERGEIVVLTRNAPTTYYSRSQEKRPEWNTTW